MTTNDATALIGRDPAMAQLHDALAITQADGGRAVVIAGEAGIGKTALVTKFTQEARDAGATVLVGATVSMDKAVPYAPLAQALRGLLRPMTDQARREVLGPARGEIARLLPSLGLATTPEADDGADDSRLRLHAALQEVLERAASPVTVLVVEDLHWADPSTLDLLSGLLASLGDTPVLLVATFRTDEVRPAHPVRGVLVEWERHPRVTRLDLGRLGDDHLHHIIAGLVEQDPSLATQAVERAGGNPFVALELARAGAHGSLPAGLRDAVLLRLGRLAPVTQDLVRTAAACGTHIRHDLLAAVTDLRPSDLRPALREAIDGHFLLAEEDGYRFRHALMAEVLHDDLLPGERREVHARYARAIEEVPELVPAGRWGALAEHRFAANDLDGAFHASLEAAKECEASSALADAVAHLARAADLWDIVPAAAATAGVGRGQLHLRAAELAALAAEPTVSLNHAERALALFEACGDDVGAAMALRWRGNGLYQLGREGMQEAYQAALAKLPNDAVLERASVLGHLAKGFALMSRYEEAEPLAAESLALIDEHGDQEDRLWARQAWAGVRSALGHADEAIEIYSELASERLSFRNGCAVHTNFGDILDQHGQYEEAVRITLEGLERLGGRIRGDRDAFLALNAAEYLMKLGRLDEARHWLTVAARPADGVARLHRVLCVARLRLLRDGVESAQSALATATRLGAQPHVGPQFSASVAHVRAWAALLGDDPESAWALATEGLEVGHEPSGRHRYSGPLLAHAMEAAVLLGQRDRVADVLARVEAFASDGRGATPEWQVWADIARAHATRLRPDDDRPGPGDPRAWQTAVDGALATSHRSLVWQIVRHLAESRLAQDQRDEVADLLLETTREADEAGALAAVALRAIARRARLVETPSEHDLTPREVEVLELIARGRTNREIGQSLFITEKTASTHVSNLLRKLGVGNRAEAAAVATRDGLVPG